MLYNVGIKINFINVNFQTALIRKNYVDDGGRKAKRQNGNLIISSWRREIQMAKVKTSLTNFGLVQNKCRFLNYVNAQFYPNSILKKSIQTKKITYHQKRDKNA